MEERLGQLQISDRGGEGGGQVESAVDCSMMMTMHASTATQLMGPLAGVVGYFVLAKCQGTLTEMGWPQRNGAWQSKKNGSKAVSTLDITTETAGRRFFWGVSQASVK